MSAGQAKHGVDCGCYWCLPERPGISQPPTYGEAVSEVHRPGHPWLWEEVEHGRMCKTCGHVEVEPSPVPPVRAQASHG